MSNYHWLKLLPLLLLSACQHVSPEYSEDNWLNDETVFAQRQIDFTSQNTWQYSAKVGVVADKVREQANIVWRFSDQANEVRLFGPLGAGQIKLEFDQYGVQLSDKNGVIHRGMASEGVSAESLLSDISGLPIPIDALAYWLFVLPTPQHVFEYQLNEQGNIAVLKQLGWQISYSDYRDYAGNFLPRLLTASRTNSSDKTQTVTVKLITKEWQWSPALSVSKQ